MCVRGWEYKSSSNNKQHFSPLLGGMGSECVVVVCSTCFKDWITVAIMENRVKRVIMFDYRRDTNSKSHAAGLALFIGCYAT